MEHSEPRDDQAELARVRPGFAHHSEAELARILDFYQVRWQYEPNTFPIGWSLDGDVVESFSPDFFLPDMDLYVELTTLKQTLVRKKNRKLRRLRELYPDVRIKLFYARDFRMLLLKFGRLGLLDELSGTTGQATPPREPAAAVGVFATAGVAALTADSVPTSAANATAEVDTAAHAAAAAAPELAGADAGRAGRGRRRGRRRRSASRSAGVMVLDTGFAGSAPA